MQRSVREGRFPWRLKEAEQCNAAIFALLFAALRETTEITSSTFNLHTQEFYHLC